MTPYSLRRRRLARFCYVLAMLSLGAGLLAGFASRDPGLGVFFMFAGVAGYILNGRRATALLSMESRKASPAPVSPAHWSRPERVAPIPPLAAHPRHSADEFSPRSVRPTAHA